MTGILLGYAIYDVFFYHLTTPKHVNISVNLLKQQDVYSKNLEEVLIRTVTPQTVKFKNTKFTFKLYEEANVWQSDDYRTIDFVHAYDGQVQKVGLTAGLTLENTSENYIWEELQLAGFQGKASLSISFTHLVDGSDLADKLFWLINDPLCMKEPPRFDQRADEVRKRVGKFCQRKLTDKELSPYVASALEQALDFIDPLTGQRAAWYEEIISCLKEYRGILEPPVTLEWAREGAYMSSFFDSSYKEEIAYWESVGGDELLK